MATRINPFESYHLSLSGDGARVICYKGPVASEYVGEILFRTNGWSPTGELSSDGERITVRMSSSMLSAVLQVLREEKPLRLEFQDGVGRLKTGSSETVGEEEGASG